MKECIFCKIASGQMGKLIWENEIAAAFMDIEPKAAVHALVVPKLHIKNLDNLEDEKLAGELLMAVRSVIAELSLVEANKVLIQGIELDHLHFHIMSDERFKL